jgi:hypothetical protein
MRGLNDRLQRKMATCLDLSYNRDVSTTLAVEAKYAGPGKSKGIGGDRSNQGPEKRQRLVIRPFNQNRSSPRPPSYPFKQPVFIRPATAPTSTTQLSAPGARFSPSRVLQPAASIVGSLDISSKTAHIQSRTSPIISRTPSRGVQVQSRPLVEFKPRQGKHDK